MREELPGASSIATKCENSILYSDCGEHFVNLFVLKSVLESAVVQKWKQCYLECPGGIIWW